MIIEAEKVEASVNPNLFKEKNTNFSYTNDSDCNEEDWFILVTC